MGPHNLGDAPAVAGLTGVAGTLATGIFATATDRSLGDGISTTASQNAANKGIAQEIGVEG